MIYVVELFSTVATTMQLAIAHAMECSCYTFEYVEETTIFVMSKTRRENTEFHKKNRNQPYYYEFMFAPKIWISLLLFNTMKIMGSKEFSTLEIGRNLAIHRSHFHRKEKLT